MNYLSLIKLIKYFVGIVVLFLFISCDPAKCLNLKRENNSSIYVYGNYNIVPYYERYEDNYQIQKLTDKVILGVNEKDSSDLRIGYGIGTWSNNSLTELSDNIDSIIFIKNNKRYSLKSKSELFKYLKNHRNIIGSKITINHDY